MCSPPPVYTRSSNRQREIITSCFSGVFFWKKLQTKDKLTVQCSHNALGPPQTPQLSPSAPQWEPYWMLWDSLGGCNITQFPPGPSNCPEQPEGRTRSRILTPEEAEAQTTALAAAPFRKCHHTHWQTGNCAWARHRILLFTRAGAEVERNFSLLASTSSWPPSCCAHALGCSHL